MRRVEPKVFLVAETALYPPGLLDYFQRIGTKWRPPEHVSGGEALVEIMGRLCYRSWEPGMNPNVKKVREGNDVYLRHIIEVKHGSVLEHATMSFIFTDVSRVFTHEFVRHRAGMAFSQESLRYVRLEDLGLWLPPETEEAGLREMFEETFTTLEQLQVKMAQVLRLDEEKSFARKKKLTSAMRRLAPIGLATSIGATFNARSLRHVLEMRTHEAAESEMRLVFDAVAKIAQWKWPNFFQDMLRTSGGEWKFGSSKV